MTNNVEGMQQLVDTKAKLTSYGTVLKDGEIMRLSDVDRVTIGDGVTAGKDRPVFLDSEHEAYVKILDGIYEGVNLEQKFATEIAGYASKWHWLQARARANNWEGIHNYDKITLHMNAGTITDGTTSYNITAKDLVMRIAGIDTFYGYGDTARGHHVTLISDLTIGTNIPWNPTNNNNGTADEHCCWLASAVYAILNGVNNASTNTYGSTKRGFDASAGGVLQLLDPDAVACMLNPREYLPERYSATANLTSSPSARWVNGGKLRLPNEINVYGCNIHSADKASDGCDRNTMGQSVQLPIFRHTCGNRGYRIKNRVSWWLGSPASSSSSRACYVNGDGGAAASDCTYSWPSVPLYFDIG